MTQADHLLTLDHGTQSVRALLFDLQGNLVSKARIEIEPYTSPQPGWAERDAEDSWQTVCAVCRLLWKESPVGPEAVAGVTVTTQRATMVCVDQNGQPLRPAIVWLDQRHTEGLAPVGGLMGLAFRAVGMSETIRYFQAEAEANWIRRFQPEIWAETRKFLFLSGFLNHRLTGTFVDSVGSQVGYVPFDYKKLQWASPKDWKWNALGIDADMLPKLVAPGSILGELTPSAAQEIGLPAGLPVVAAAADKACEVLGAGCVEPSIGALSYGTTATVNTTHRRYVEPLAFLPPYPAAMPDHYLMEVQIYRGYWMVSWFKREFGLREEQLASDRGVDAEMLFDDLVAAVPPGSMGLTLQPYWSPGVKMPGPEAKGAVIGFGDVHTRGHLYRSILEGLAYGLREGAERTARRSKVPMTALRVAGGGSQSDAAMQLTADIFGLPAARPHVYEASGLGAAINVAVALGLHGDFPAAVAAMTRTGRTFEPIAENHRLYDQLYREVYLKMYDRLKPLYRKIRDITGYPPKPE
jgi:sugar (pentulose or hexulose) kinase